MGIFEQFPHSNFHDLNLDWILDKIKHLEENVTPPDLEKIKADILANSRKNYEQDVALAKLDGNIRRQYLQVTADIARSLAAANDYTDQRIAEFPDLHTVYVVSPVTGDMVDIQTCVDQLYDAMRPYALSAAEYDAKELTADTYDGKMLTASQYDFFAAQLLN